MLLRHNGWIKISRHQGRRGELLCAFPSRLNEASIFSIFFFFFLRACVTTAGTVQSQFAHNEDDAARSGGGMGSFAASVAHCTCSDITSMRGEVEFTCTSSTCAYISHQHSIAHHVSVYFSTILEWLSRSTRDGNPCENVGAPFFQTWCVIRHHVHINMTSKTREMWSIAQVVSKETNLIPKAKTFRMRTEISNAFMDVTWYVK